MGLFGKKQTEEAKRIDSEQELKAAKEEIKREILSKKSISYAPTDPPTFKEALDYFDTQSISYKSTADEKAIIRIYRAITEQKDVTFWADNAEDSVETHDANMNKLFRAVIYQNFMLMRKVDDLSKKVDELGKK